MQPGIDFTEKAGVIYPQESHSPPPGVGQMTPAYLWSLLLSGSLSE